MALKQLMMIGFAILDKLLLQLLNFLLFFLLLLVALLLLLAALTLLHGIGDFIIHQQHLVKILMIHRVFIGPL
jgi:hypothetical protein